MASHYFAGPVLTIQQAIVFFLGVFVVFSLGVGLVIFMGKKIVDKARKESNGKPLGLGKALMTGFGSVAIIILLFLVLPTIIKDSNWKSKQQACAKKAGYESPGDDNSNRATAESQAMFRKCLDL